MRINGESPPYVVEITRQEQLKPNEPANLVPQAASAPRPSSRERVEISAGAREIERLTQELAALPELRLEKVALVKQQMQYGSYRVDPTEVAQQMVESQRRR